MRNLWQIYLALIVIAALATPSISAETQPPAGFILIKGGAFTMGSPSAEFLREQDEVAHSVTLRDFYMARHEVTQREYRELTGHSPSEFAGDDLPVENVSWFDAITYCNARSAREGLAPAYRLTGSTVTWNREANGYRLPTEAEWEYAARAGTSTPFHTGENVTQAQANYYGHYPYRIERHYFSSDQMAVPPGRYLGSTAPVGSYAANAWGLHSMHGNVSEWCWDWYGAYPSGPQNNPAGPASGVYRVNRGGGWNDFGRHLRSAYRSPYPPGNATFNIGFRLVRNAAAISF